MTSHDFFYREDLYTFTLNGHIITSITRCCCDSKRVENLELNDLPSKVRENLVEKVMEELKKSS